MTKITYTPEQAERIETVYHKLTTALDCLDDVADILHDCNGEVDDGKTAARTAGDANAEEYFTRYIAAFNDVNFARDELFAALSVYKKYLGVHTDPYHNR